MGSEEVWEMRETAVNDATPMLAKESDKDEITSTGPLHGTSRYTHVTIHDDNAGADEKIEDLSLPGRDHPHIDWSRRRSSAPPDVDELSWSEHHLRHHERWRAFSHNRYATRKTAAQGMMDMALMLANASQLKSVVQEGGSHEHYHLLLTLIITSIGLQILTGIILLFVGARESRWEDDQHKRNEKTSKLNNFSVALVFVITVTNIFITSFGINGNTSSLVNSGSGSGESGDIATGTGSGIVNT